MTTHRRERDSFNDRLLDDLVRVLWMGLGGRNEDLARYLRRVLPTWGNDHPLLAERVSNLLSQSAVRQGIVRKAAQPVSNGDPVDLLSPLAEQGDKDFLHIESGVCLSIEPVWPPAVRASLSSLVSERGSVERLALAGLAPTRTAIFTGPPGVGKTLAARWIARELALPLCVLDLGSVMSSFLGRTGTNLRQAMTYALANPCILLLDEIDAIAKRRDDNSDVGELKRLVTVLLQELDAWPSTNLLIAATNHEQLLDPAIWRRFEQRIEFEMPQATQQAELLGSLLGKEWINMAEPIRRAIAVSLEGFSPSDLTLLALRAKREAVLGGASLFERITDHVRQAVHALPLDRRRQVGEQLKKQRVGQREIHRLTGLARETIREMKD